jgi:hypothetical protein
VEQTMSPKRGNRIRKNDPINITFQYQALCHRDSLQIATFSPTTTHSRNK